MRLLTLLILVFFTSFLTFRGKKYVFSELIFLISGFIAGMFIKGIERDIYTFFELSLLGFFGLVYGMSIDVTRVIKSSPGAVKKAIIEVLLGAFLILLFFSLLHYHLLFSEKLAIAVFVLIGASPYFVKDTPREVVISSFFVPAVVATITGIIHFHFFDFIVLFVILLVIAYVIKYTFSNEKDTVIALSVILGSAVIIPYVALRYHESPFFYAFLLGIVIINVMRNKDMMSLILRFQDDEKMFFLVFLFMVGLSTRITKEVIFYAIIIYFVKVMFKGMMVKLFHSGKNIRYYIAQGGIGLVMMVDILGPEHLLTGVGASLVTAYFFNLLFMALMSFRENYR